MAVTQYIGARYVPLFADPAEWDNTQTYEPLTIVLHEGNSYTSKQYVPVGIDIDNTDYWAETGNYNAQVEQYREEVLQFDERITTAQDTADTAQSEIDAITPFDDTPTESSEKGVTSGGVYDAIQTVNEELEQTKTEVSEELEQTKTEVSEELAKADYAGKHLDFAHYGQLHVFSIQSMCSDGDGHIYAFGTEGSSYEGTAQCYRLDSDANTLSYKDISLAGDHPNGATMLPDGTFLIADRVGEDDSSNYALRVYDWSSNSVTDTGITIANIYGVAYDADTDCVWGVVCYPNSTDNFDIVQIDYSDWSYNTVAQDISHAVDGAMCDCEYRDGRLYIVTQAVNATSVMVVNLSDYTITETYNNMRTCMEAEGICYHDGMFLLSFRKSINEVSDTAIFVSSLTPNATCSLPTSVYVDYDSSKWMGDGVSEDTALPLITALQIETVPYYYDISGVNDGTVTGFIYSNNMRFRVQNAHFAGYLFLMNSWILMQNVVFEDTEYVNHSIYSGNSVVYLSSTTYNLSAKGLLYLAGGCTLIAATSLSIDFGTSSTMNYSMVNCETITSTEGTVNITRSYVNGTWTASGTNTSSLAPVYEIDGEGNSVQVDQEETPVVYIDGVRQN